MRYGFLMACSSSKSTGPTLSNNAIAAEEKQLIIVQNSQFSPKIPAMSFLSGSYILRDRYAETYASTGKTGRRPEQVPKKTMFRNENIGFQGGFKMQLHVYQ